MEKGPILAGQAEGGSDGRRGTRRRSSLPAGAAAGPTTPSSPISQPQYSSASHESWSFVMRASRRTHRGKVSPNCPLRCLSTSDLADLGRPPHPFYLLPQDPTLKSWDLDSSPMGKSQMDQACKVVVYEEWEYDTSTMVLACTPWPYLPPQSPPLLPASCG
jgi:hypothetical protein